MSLTPEQIQAAREKYGVPAQGYGNLIGNGQTTHTVTSSPTNGGDDWYAKMQQEVRARQGLTQPSTPQLGEGAAGEFAGNAVRAVVSPLVRTGGMIESVLDQTLGRGINAIEGKGFVPTHTGEQTQQAATSIDQNANDTLAGHVGTFAGQIAPYLTGLGEEEAGAQLASHLPALAEKLGLKADSFLPKLAGYLTSKVPQLASNTAIGTAQTGDLGEGAKTGAEALAGQEMLRGAGKLVAPALKPVDFVQQAIDAVNPKLAGKSRAQAYKDVVTGKRTVKPATLFGSQDVTPTKEIKDLGTRLSDVIRSSDNLKNLESLGTDLQKTEVQIEHHLTGDPEMQYTADKPMLFQRLEEGQKNMPLEDQAIRDNKNTFKQVFNYAKKLTQNADDSIGGIRGARIRFDAQAKREFPSAYKDGGYIDVKTPAGRAIKAARDIFNEHLYETAPTGSEIKILIQREADIFRAADYIGPKAAEQHGYNALQKATRFFKDHPIVAGITGLTAAGAAAGAIANTVRAAKGE